MEKIWLKSYPANMPQEIDARQYGSLVALLDEAMRKYKDRVAFRCMGAALTYGELDQQSARVASWLQARGLQKGSRVAVMMPNVLQYPVVVAGILRAGCVVVNVNPMYTPRELEHQLHDSGAEVIFILENFATTLQAIQARGHLKHVVVASMGDLIRVPMPPMTEERRKELVKVVRGEAEGGKVAIRNIRRDAIAHLKDLLKNHEVSEDDERRAQDDIAKASKFAAEKFATAMLPVKDSLEAALATENQTVEKMREGVELTLRQLISAFEGAKLAEENPLGQKFDPNKHQAISMVEADAEPNTVVTVLQKGYLLSERVIRPAMVMVSKGKAQ